MQKRGLSTIITSVMIILLGLAAVVIIWTFVKPALENSGEQIGLETLSVSFDIDKNSIVLSPTQVDFKFVRKSGAGTVTGYKVLLDDSFGSRCVVNKIKSINELESVSVSVIAGDCANIDFDKLHMISVHPLITNSGKEFIGVANTFIVGTQSFAVCQNGIKEGTEQCDQSDLDSETCITKGFTSGNLICDNSCNFDTSSCFTYLSTGTMDYLSYLGGIDPDKAIAMTTDNSGNIYITGSTNRNNADIDDFPVTATVADPSGLSFDDVFVTKFTPDGQTLIYSIIIGGDGPERGLDIEVNDQGEAIIVGIGGINYPMKNPIQSVFRGYNAGGNFNFGNAFITKINSQGTDILFSTFMGTGHESHSIDLDSNGDIFMVFGYNKDKDVPPSPSIRPELTPELSGKFTGKFQSTGPGDSDFGIIKVKGDGSAVEWATYISGSAKEPGAGTVRIGKDDDIYFLGSTQSTDFPTMNAFDTDLSGNTDYVIAKLNPDATNLIFSSYLGGSDEEFVNRNMMMLDSQDTIYFASFSLSTDFPGVSGAYQSIKSADGGKTDGAISKISSSGQLLASTYYGGNGAEIISGIGLSPDGGILVAGQSDSTNLAMVGNSYRNFNNGGTDSFIAKFNNDLSNLLYSTYFGSSTTEENTDAIVNSQGEIIFTGQTFGSDLPVTNAYQSTFGGVRDVYFGKMSFS